MRRTKEQAQQTYDQILASALYLFDERGYSTTTLAQIAEKAEVTRGAIYHHFANKEEILKALSARQLMEIQTMCEEALSAPNTWLKLSELFLWFIENINSDLPCTRFFRIIKKQANSDKIIHEIDRTHQMNWQEKCLNILEKSKLKNEIPVHIQTEELFFYLQNIFAGFCELYSNSEWQEKRILFSQKMIKNAIPFLLQLK